MAPNLWTVSGDSFTVEHFAELRSVASGQRCARTVSRVARLGPEDAIAPLEAIGRRGGVGEERQGYAER